MKVEHRLPVEQLRAKRRILVVDDHAGFRSCAGALLQAEGFEVVGEAEDGATAVARAGEVAPELVLLDIQLPDMDGFEVTKRLLAADPELLVVLVSSRDRSSYGERIDESGACGFLTKSDLSGDVLEGLLV
jgi:DNA-binding NarL/FixJ family response regulator